MASKTYGPVKGNTKELSASLNSRNNKEFGQSWKPIVKTFRIFYEEIEIVLLSIWQWIMYIWANIFYSREKQIVHDWVKEHVPGFSGDFKNSWKDGVYFCSLLESLYPGCCPRPDLLDKNHGKKNVKKALDILQKVSGIVPDITIEEIVNGTADSEKKLVATLRMLKKKSESINRNDFDSHTLKNDFRLSCTPEVQPCFAKGIGLVVGFVSRVARFSLFFDPCNDLDIVVEVKGPNNTLCCERITSRSPKRKKSSAILLQRPRLTRIGRSMSLNEGFVVEPTEVDSRNAEEIRFEYEIQTDKVTIGYIPMQKGQHKVTVLWHGHHISGSPFNVGVEDAFEKLTDNSLLKLKSPIHFKGTLNSHINRNSKSKKQSVRFKDTDTKHCCKVKHRKTLRYIVNIGGKEVVVDAESSDMLAPALLKLEYELDDNRLVGRRNSWGFTGDVERKKSIVRQFGVNPENTDYAMNRRTSLTIVSNSEINKLEKTQENNENSEAIIGLKTVTEGVDKDSHEDEGIYDVDMDRNWTDELSHNEISQSHVIISERNKKHDSNLKNNNFSITSNQITNIETENAFLNKDFKHNFKTTNASPPRELCILPEHSNETFAEDVIHKKEISELCSTDTFVEDNELSIHTKGITDTKEEKTSEIVSSALQFLNETPEVKTSMLVNSENDEDYNFDNVQENSSPFSGKSKSTCAIKKNKKTLKKRHLAIKRQIHKLKPNSSRKSQIALKSMSNQEFLGTETDQINGERITKYSFSHVSDRTSQKPLQMHHRSHKILKPVDIKKIVREPRLISSNVTMESTSTNIPQIYSEEETSSQTSKNVPDFTFENISKDTGIKNESTDYRKVIERKNDNQYFTEEWPLLRSTYMLQQLEKKQPLLTKTSYKSKLVRQVAIETSGSETDASEEVSCSHRKPKLIVQPYRERGSSLRELSLPPVKDLVRSLERERQQADHERLENNLYSHNLSFPPLAVNVDRKKVITRIKQWETSSLPSSVHKSKDAFHQSLDKYKLSVLSDVQTKTVFWENMYQKYSSDSRIPDKIEKERWERSTKFFKSTRSEEGTPITARRESVQKQQNSKDFESRIEKENDLDFLPDAEKCSTPPTLNSHSSQQPRRRHSDPGPFLDEEENRNINIEFKLPYRKTGLSRTNSTSTLDAMSSIIQTTSFDDEGDSYRDEYIDDEIPDYAAMFLDDYAGNSCPLFDRKNSSLRPNADACKVFGSGINYGSVSTKNHFQVLTKGAGRGNLSVSVLGSSTHDVTYVSVTYVRKDIYDVTYQVLEPGYYLISVRWSDVPVPGSPFVCKVTY